LRASRLRGSSNRALRSFCERTKKGGTYSDGHCDGCDGVVGMGVVRWVAKLRCSNRYAKTETVLCKPPAEMRKEL
jgi:hypothetical protein